MINATMCSSRTLSTTCTPHSDLPQSPAWLVHRSAHERSTCTATPQDQIKRRQPLLHMQGSMSSIYPRRAHVSRYSTSDSAFVRQEQRPTVGLRRCATVAVRPPSAIAPGKLPACHQRLSGLMAIERSMHTTIDAALCNTRVRQASLHGLGTRQRALCRHTPGHGCGREDAALRPCSSSSKAHGHAGSTLTGEQRRRGSWHTLAAAVAAWLRPTVPVLRS